jgi:hypothetical protein
MDENEFDQPEQKSLTATETVRQFVTEGWISPAISKETIRHREEAKNRLTKTLSEQGISSDKYFAAMVGSVYGVASEHSDFDYVVYCQERELYEKLRNASESKYSSEPLSKALNKKNIDFHWGESVVDYDKLVHSDEYDRKAWRTIATLLYTPNEFIVGNVEAANALRLQIIRREDLNWKEIEQQFKDYYLNWGTTDTLLSKGIVSHDTSREERIQKVFTKRSQDKKYPKDGYRKFVAWKSRISFPDQESFRTALEASGGAITLMNPIGEHPSQLPLPKEVTENKEPQLTAVRKQIEAIKQKLRGRS